MVDQSGADAECISEMHTRHGGQLINVFAAHEDTLGIVMANSVQETVFLGQETGRRAWVENECGESTEIGESHRSASNGEGIE